MNTKHSNNPTSHLDSETLPMAQALDALGRADALHPDGIDSLNDRLIASTRGTYAAARRTVHVPAPRDTAAPRRLFPMSRVGAVLALVVGVSIAWIGLRPTLKPQGGPVAAQPVDVESMLAGLDALDAASPMTDLSRDAASVEDAVRSAKWNPAELIEASESQGSL